MLRGNTVYCMKLSGEDLSKIFEQKIELVGLRKRPFYHYRTKKVMQL